MAAPKYPFVPCNENDILVEDEELLKPYTYFLPGDDTMAKLISAFNIWLKIPDDKLRIVTEIVEFVENSNLVCDGLDDNVILNRSIPPAQAVYGVGGTINAANYAYCFGFDKVFSLQHPEAVKIFCEQTLKIHRGRGMEIYWRDNFICPSEEEYTRMVLNKTGGLILLAIKLMQLFSYNKSDFTKFVDILAFYFQACDECYDLNKQEPSDQWCRYVTEGKFTFPVIHAIESHPENGKVIHILRQRTKENSVKKLFISLLDKYGSLKYASDKLLIADKNARDEIKKLSKNPSIEEILDEKRKQALTYYTF